MRAFYDCYKEKGILTPQELPICFKTISGKATRMAEGLNRLHAERVILDTYGTKVYSNLNFAPGDVLILLICALYFRRDSRLLRRKIISIILSLTFIFFKLILSLSNFFPRV